MSESDTVFNERDRRCAAVQLMLSTDPSYHNRTIASTLKMQINVSTLEGAAQHIGRPFGRGGAEGHIIPPHIFEVGLKVNTKVYLDLLEIVVIPWCNQVPGYGSRTREHHQHDLRQHQSQPYCRHLPSSRQRLWKRYAPSSGSVSRRWLRLKAATLNRCQLYIIIKLPELIFSIKVLKWSCSLVFFKTIILSFHHGLS